MTFGECLSAFLLEQIFVVCTVPSSTIRGKQHSVKQDQNVESFGMSDTNFRTKFIVWNTFKNRYDTTRIGISFLRNWSKNLANMCLFFHFQKGLSIIHFPSNWLFFTCIWPTKNWYNLEKGTHNDEIDCLFTRFWTMKVCLKLPSYSRHTNLGLTGM